MDTNYFVEVALGTGLSARGSYEYQSFCTYSENTLPNQ
jgi:hypothetical protein